MPTRPADVIRSFSVTLPPDTLVENLSSPVSALAVDTQFIPPVSVRVPELLCLNAI